MDPRTSNTKISPEHDQATASTPPRVSRRLRAAFDVLDDLVRPEVRPTIQESRGILETTQATLLPAGSAEISKQPDRHGLG